MNKLYLATLIALMAATTPGEAAAQGRPSVPPAPQRDRDEEPQVPSRYLPPAGMCRIWLEDVPASRQPAPTDCITALRNKPANGRVIFGDPLPSRKKGKSGNPFGISFED
ncbi:MAG TPA: hypothetical protein VMY38_09155 [Gemmatimonadaceae bacterium]|nr:hypothetical protein [Gemmatimonadaceae bacterium]